MFQYDIHIYYLQQKPVPIFTCNTTVEAYGFKVTFTYTTYNKPVSMWHSHVIQQSKPPVSMQHSHILLTTSMFQCNIRIYTTYNRNLFECNVHICYLQRKPVSMWHSHLIQQLKPVVSMRHSHILLTTEISFSPHSHLFLTTQCFNVAFLCTISVAKTYLPEC